MEQNNFVLILLLILQEQTTALLAVYKYQLSLYYTRINLRYMTPYIQYEPRNIPDEFHALYGHREFKLYFRMSFNTFNTLADELKECYIQYSGQSRVQKMFKWKLAIYLRFLARAECLQSLKHTFGCCIETVRATMHCFKHLMLYTLRDSLQIDINDENKFRESSQDIKALTNGLLDGFCFIIDGTHIPIIKLPANIPHQCFYNRKGGRSINCQAVINSSLEIVSFDCGYPGSTNDSQMLKISGFADLMKEIYYKYNGQYACLADNGYPLREHMLTPYTAGEILSDSNSEQDKVQFNAIFSSVRQAVERVFGILQRKWHLLVVGCEYNIDDYLMFVQSIMLIHNFMILNEETYKHTIMNDRWDFEGLPISLEDSITQLNALRDDPSFEIENDHLDLALGEQRRDLIRINMPLVNEMN